jgi:succinate dehydrogenase / fumarate reductase iron-sulfur subunit|tara:strand:- start:841 stop:1590 length:750 start_codon:yes stop_codon:yes gene_type:complete
MKISIYRFDPDKDKKPYMQDYDVEVTNKEVMLLDLLIKIKAMDDSLSMRMSCREGVCGSDAMNINGKNGLACVTKIADLKQPIVIRPMPALPVIRDLVVNMDQFFKQYNSVKPYLINSKVPPKQERLQSPEDRRKLDGLYECILCGACTTSCPSFWWSPDKFVGPAGLLQSYRFLADSRDDGDNERLADLDDPDRLYRCHNIMNCADVCPKNLNPSKAISGIKQMQIKSKKATFAKNTKKIFTIKQDEK